MSTLLMVVGLIWAGFGVANLFGLNYMDPNGANLLAFAWIFNMMLFILPGLGLAGLGKHIGGKKPPNDQVSHD